MDVRGLVGALLAALAAVVTFAGSFLPLYRIEQSMPTVSTPRSSVYFLLGAWTTAFGTDGQEPISRPSAPLGVSMLVAAAILVAGAVLGVRAALSGRPGLASARTTPIGAAFLAGTVLTIVLQSMLYEADAEGIKVTISLQSGMWLLFVAVAAGAAATVLAFRRPAVENPAWADPAVAYADTPTPPSGVAITMLPPER